MFSICRNLLFAVSVESILPREDKRELADEDIYSKDFKRVIILKWQLFSSLLLSFGLLCSLLYRQCPTSDS